MFDYLRVAFFEKYDLGRAYHRLTREGLVLMKMPELWQSQFMIFYENPISVQMLFFSIHPTCACQKMWKPWLFHHLWYQNPWVSAFPSETHVFCVAWRPRFCPRSGPRGPSANCPWRRSRGRSKRTCSDAECGVRKGWSTRWARGPGIMGI